MSRPKVESMTEMYCSSSAIEGRQMAAAITGPGRISPHHGGLLPRRRREATSQMGNSQYGSIRETDNVPYTLSKVHREAIGSVYGQDLGNQFQMFKSWAGLPLTRCSLRLEHHRASITEAEA